MAKTFIVRLPSEERLFLRTLISAGMTAAHAQAHAHQAQSTLSDPASRHMPTVGVLVNSA
jgi:hypothetical protein